MIRHVKSRKSISRDRFKNMYDNRDEVMERTPKSNYRSNFVKKEDVEKMIGSTKDEFYKKLENQLNSSKKSTELSTESAKKEVEISKIPDNSPKIENKSAEISVKSNINPVNSAKSKRKYTYKEPEKYKCSVCGKGFGTAQALKWHEFGKHSGKKEENKEVNDGKEDKA